MPKRPLAAAAFQFVIVVLLLLLLLFPVWGVGVNARNGN